MKKPRRLYSVFAGCFTLFLIGTAFAVRADEKDDLEKQRLEELKRVEAMLNAQIDALIEREKADPNDAKSLYELGVRCMKADKLADYDPFTAIELYCRAAEMGYAEAQYAYGKMYLVSLHEILPRAAAKAEGVKWLQKAADQGHEKAQLALAKCYSSGEGVKKDEAKAFEVYRKAADAGSVPRSVCDVWKPFAQTTSGQVYSPVPSPSAETTSMVRVPVLEPFGAPKRKPVLETVVTGALA